MLTIQQVHPRICQEAWLTFFDLKDAYWHVSTHLQFRQFLAFQVSEIVVQFFRGALWTKYSLQSIRKGNKSWCQDFRLFYQDDWMIITLSKQKSSQMTTQQFGQLRTLSYHGTC